MSEQSLQIKCGHCHTTEQFKIGHDDGMDTLQKAVAMLQGKTQIQVRSILRNHKIDHAEYGFALYACPKCQTLHNPFDVKVEYDEIMLFQPFYKCQRCNSTLLKATEPVASYACRQCGEKQLST